MASKLVKSKLPRSKLVKSKLTTKTQRRRRKCSLPSENISEDIAVPLPVDI